SKPILYQEFMRSESTRRRYWTRSYLGWGPFSAAAPNPAHHALVRLERAGHVVQLVTQNVDGLHQKAGSQRVIDLHGRLASLRCQQCGERESRRWMQQRLTALNPGIGRYTAAQAPDGDADLDIDFENIRIPPCPTCGGILKPDVVFYGEQVPRPRIERAYQALQEADGLLVAGTSLMVFSAFQFVREAARLGKPVAAVNRGRTRADDLFTLKLERPVADILDRLVTIPDRETSVDRWRPAGRRHRGRKGSRQG
ncbi:MAG: NAD-dependent protein deacetylase, partial [Sedimenticola sp.]|nr:NAD-dependent protein deacetylase [Sedimenticola sp.]